MAKILLVEDRQDRIAAVERREVVSIIARLGHG
jgi:hypothetical protein